MGFYVVCQLFSFQVELATISTHERQFSNVHLHVKLELLCGRKHNVAPLVIAQIHFLRHWSTIIGATNLSVDLLRGEALHSHLQLPPSFKAGAQVLPNGGLSWKRLVAHLAYVNGSK